MPGLVFESAGERNFAARSPGGYEFGVQGWTWGDPIPKSITFFLDNTAMVCDQYGRQIRRAMSPDGSNMISFAFTAPDASQEGLIVPRPQFATHAQVIAALTAERIDWLSYEVRWRANDGRMRVQSGLNIEQASKIQLDLIQKGTTQVMLDRTISCAGWPQLSYEELKKLPELPPTPEAELRKIRDPKLREAALRIKSEAAARNKEE